MRTKEKVEEDEIKEKEAMWKFETTIAELTFAPHLSRQREKENFNPRI